MDTPAPTPAVFRRELLLHHRDDSRIESAFRAGRTARLVPGWHVPTDQWIALTPWERTELTAAAVSLYRPSATFSGITALQLQGFPGRVRAHVLIPFVIITLIWGSTWLVIRDQLGVVPAGWSVTYRFATATIAMIGYALVTRTLEKARQTLAELRARLGPELPFAKAARIYSDDDRTKEFEGRLGWLTRLSTRAEKSVVDAAFELAPERVSEPVRTREGYALVRVRRIEGPPDETRMVERVIAYEVARERAALL